MDPQIPRAGKRSPFRRAALDPRLQRIGLPAGAGNRHHGLGREVHFAKKMIFRIGDIEDILMQRTALRMIERCRREIAIVAANRAAADGVKELAVEVGHDNAVMVAVADEETIAWSIGQHFAREQQRRIGGFHQVNGKRLFVQEVPLAIVGDAPLQDFRHVGGFELPGGSRHNFAFRVHEQHRRPDFDAVKIPQVVLVVVHHEVLHFVAEHGLDDVLAVLFGLEFGGVNTNHHELIREPLLQLLELRQNVHAVDAAVGPKIEEDELPFQIGFGNGLLGVVPLHSLGKLGQVHAVAKGVCRSGRFLCRRLPLAAGDRRKTHPARDATYGEEECSRQSITPGRHDCRLRKRAEPKTTLVVIVPRWLPRGSKDGMAL